MCMQCVQEDGRQAMNASSGGDSPDTLVSTLDSQTTQLTRKIRGLLATMRKEPLAHGLDGRTNLRLHHELAPKTPRAAEAPPKLPGLPSTLSSSPEPSTALASCTPVLDGGVPGSLSHSLSPITSSVPDADSAHYGCTTVSLSSSTPKAHATAAQPLTGCTPDSARPECSVRSSSSDPDMATGHEHRDSQQSAPGYASGDAETISPCDNASDAAEAELSLDEVEYARFLQAVLDWGESTHTPAAATRRPVQLWLSIHTDTAACPQQQLVQVQLCVTENDRFVKYQAACCGPDDPQEKQPLQQHPLSLEWLREVHIEKARQYLMDVTGTASDPCTCKGACIPKRMLANREQVLLAASALPQVRLSWAFALTLTLQCSASPSLSSEACFWCAGLGRKSVACVLLLALHKKDFPVDVNVARICARLGWIPLDSEEAIEVCLRPASAFGARFMV